MFEALAGGSFTPATEAGWLERFPHMSDDLAFLQTGDFTNLFECDAVSPGGPNDPIGAVFGWFGLFNPGHGKFGLLGFHRMFEDIKLVLLRGWANNRLSVVSKKYCSGNLSRCRGEINHEPEKNLQERFFSPRRKYVSMGPLPLISILLGLENSKASPNFSRMLAEI